MISFQESAEQVTRKRKRYRNVCFTINNPKGQIDYENMPGLKYMVFQLEQGANGTVHYQGYAEFSKQYSLKQLQVILPGGHFETRRGTAQQAADYCKKEESRVEGPWEVSL